MKVSNSHTPKLLALSLCMLPMAGFAADEPDTLSYGYLEVDYINLDIDQADENLNIFKSDFDNGGGYGISLSVPINESFFVFADYSDTESDFTFRDNAGVFYPSNTDIKRFNLGLGFVAPLSEATDMVFSGGYADVDYGRFRLGATGNSSLNDLENDPSDGFMVDAKLRSQLSQTIEGSIGARYTDIEDAEGLSLVGNIMYEFAPNWGVNLSIDAGDDLVTWGAGIRYIF